MNTSRAAELFFYLTREAARFGPCYYFLGLAQLGTNYVRQAKIAFTKAKELVPVWLEPRMALARIYVANGD